MSYERTRGLGADPPPLVGTGTRPINIAPVPVYTPPAPTPPPAPAPIPTPGPPTLKSTWDEWNPYTFIKGNHGWPGQVGALAAITGLGYYLYKKRKR